MDSKLLNDRLQLTASVGVVIGLFMLIVEIRQNSDIARDDTYVAIAESWGMLSISEFESDIGTIFEKSMESPETMTNAELFRLGAWIQTFVQIWQLQLEMDQGAVYDVASEISSEAYYLFGNHASRAWYSVNRYWMSPEITDAIDDYIANNPVGGDAAYFEAMREYIRASMAEAE
jgi:hypothetical protein